MEIIGTLHAVLEEKQVTEKLRTLDFVIKTEEQYPQTILIQLANNTISLLQHHRIGDRLKVNINLSGREYKNQFGEVKYFNTIKAWKIERQ